MSRYAIWDKKSPVITPVGQVFTAKEWIDKHPVAALDTIKIVCGGGEINGSFFGTFGNLKETAAKMGCDFSKCTTDQEVLDTIEAFEDALNTPVEPEGPTTDERIAAALEAQVMMSLPDEVM